MKERELDFRIIEKAKALVVDDKQYIHGDATDPQVLKQAGFFEAPAVAITSHSDPINIYLTTYCRRLRKDIQIISRATLDRNIRTLHTAGCDFVISHASLGANSIFNLSRCGCNVVGICADGKMMINPYHDIILPADGEMILIGSVESEEKFFRLYKPKE
jgi:Trk K+ transport system NAD-binding subunit